MPPCRCAWPNTVWACIGCSTDSPRQVLVYVGEAPMRMDSELRGDDVSFRYRAVDIRELDGERLLASGEVGDNVIAILARLPDQQEGIRRIVGRIAGLEPDERAAALSELLIGCWLEAFGRDRGTGGPKNAAS